MKKLGIALAVVAIAAFLYKLRYPTYTYRYRMTVEVDVGGEIRSGSSVIEVKVSRQPQFLPEVGPLSETVRGEAVFVEIPGGGNIVALLTSIESGQDASYPTLAVPFAFKLNLLNDKDLARLPDLRGSRELPNDKLPTLVTISDPKVAKSLRVIRPAQLEQVLGPQVHWRRITIEITTDAVTRTGIEERLPFLVQLKGRPIEYPYPPRFYLQHQYFMRS